MIYVTHDQVEAMTLGNRIAVFNQGVIEQIGAPLEVYQRPANVFVAGFMGAPKINLVAQPSSAAELAHQALWKSLAGERLAGLVLRRHRLVELFLVQVLGMSWDEVHDDAEHLEHVVSDRLIERIDEMLGRPTYDPHGDPIPTAEGLMPTHHHDSLMTCPIGTSLRMTRITDQDPAFLRFVERNDLKPGQTLEVASRDTAADAVRLVGEGRAELTIGTRAASKLLVEVVS